MNISAPLGFIIGAVVVFFSARSEVKNPFIFLSPHAAAIVLGGTLAASLICFPLGHFYNLIKVLLSVITGRAREMTLSTINEIVTISIAINDGRTIGSEIATVKNPFLKESLELLDKGGLADAELKEVLEKRIEFQNEKYHRDGLTFKVIGKFPPAFGLVGTTMGMIALLQGLGEPDAFERLGPSMSIALVATFYGLILANVILIPLGENLNNASEVDLMMRRIVMDGVLLLKEQKHPLLVEEYLKSYISPDDRAKMKKAQTG